MVDVWSGKFDELLGNCWRSGVGALKMMASSLSKLIDFGRTIKRNSVKIVNA